MGDFIQHLKVEHEELADKTKKLRSFVGSDKFKEISPDEQALLKLQLRQMDAYLSTLDQRLRLYGSLPTEEELEASLETVDGESEDKPDTVVKAPKKPKKPKPE